MHIEAACARASISVDVALEISLPSNCRHTKHGLEIKSHYGKISRKYGIIIIGTMQGILYYCKVL